MFPGRLQVWSRLAGAIAGVAGGNSTQPGPLHNLVTTMFPARKSYWHGYVLREGEKLLFLQPVREDNISWELLRLGCYHPLVVVK